jgi:hypothetical protein
MTELNTRRCGTTKKGYRSLDRRTILHFPVSAPTGKVSILPTIEDKWRIGVNSWIHLFFAFRSVLGKHLGQEKASEILAQSWLFMVGEPGKILDGYRKAFRIEGKGAQIISRLAQFQSVAEGHDVEMIADKPRRSGWRSVCIWWNEWNRGWHDGNLKGFEKDICYSGCRNIWIREMQTLDHSLRMHQTKWMGQGDPYCEFIIEKKKAAGDRNFAIDRR